MTSTPLPDYAPDPRRWQALTVCLLAGFMTLLDVSIVNVALPSIKTGLGASPSDLQWIVSGYALTFGLVLVPSGRLGDVRGRRTMFIVGVAVFTVSSLGAGLAPTATWLVAARLAQGVGGGILNPQVSGLIQELFRGRERARAFGMLGTTIGLSTAVGPVTGGLLIGAFGADVGWRWIFFVNLPIGAAAVLLSRRLLPAPTPRPQRRDLDPVAVLLLGAAVVATLLPLVEDQQWSGSTKWLLLPLGALLAALFVGWERRFSRRGRAPLVDLGLFAHPSYSAGSGLACAYFSGFTGIFFVLTLYFQDGLRYSALDTGLALTPFALASAAGAAVGGRFVTRIGRPLVVGGLLLVVVGVITTDLVIGHDYQPGRVGWYTAIPLLAAGLGSGLVISPNITLTLSDVPVARAGIAGGVLQTGQRLGTAAGIALVGSLYFNRLVSSRGDFPSAASAGLRATVGLTLLALVLGGLDLVRQRGSRLRPAEQGRSGPG